MVKLGRRAFLQGLSAAAASSLLPLKLRGAGPETPATLRQLAEARQRYFGAAVFARHLRRDQDFAATIARECNLIVAEGDMKWDAIWPRELLWTFEQADHLADFAEEHEMAMRGHTCIWHQAMPEWAKQAIRDGRGPELMETFIARLLDRYKGRMISWDVVNEAADPKAPGETYRDTFWLRGMGEGYIAQAFRLARAADPSARLIYNDFDAERGDAQGTAKRAALLRLLRDLQRQNAPIDGVGLQSHLVTYRPFPRKAFIAFCKSVRAMGHEIIVTELDVYEGTPAHDKSYRQRDAAIAEMAREFLEALWSVWPPREVVTWGLSDRYTWRRWYHKDDTLRPLPLDDNMERKAMWHEIARALSR